MLVCTVCMYMFWTHRYICGDVYIRSADSLQENTTTKVYRHVHVPVHVHACCWLLLSNQHFKGPYLVAEVVEEIMGWLG